MVFGSRGVLENHGGDVGRLHSAPNRGNEEQRCYQMNRNGTSRLEMGEERSMKKPICFREIRRREILVDLLFPNPEYNCFYVFQDASKVNLK